MQDTRPIREFDHFMCGVKDVEAVGDTFEALGFTVGPVTPLEGVGVSNRRILLTPKQENIANYIEFMQLGGASGTIPNYLNKWLAGSLTGDEGAHCCIMRSDDAHATYAHFEKRHQEDPEDGFKPILLEQDFDQVGPDGELYNVSFSNCIMPDLEPPLLVSTSQIRTLDFYLNSKWRTHANGAVSWVGAIAVSTSPMDTAVGLQDIWGGTIERPNLDTVVSGPGEIPLKTLTPNGFKNIYGVPAKDGGEKGAIAPYLAGAKISVADLTQTRDFLTARDVNIVVKEGYVIVPPEYAHGLMLCFVQDPDVGVSG